MRVILAIQYGPKNTIVGFVGAEPETKIEGAWKKVEERNNAPSFEKGEVAERVAARYLDYIKAHSCCMDVNLMRIEQIPA